MIEKLPSSQKIEFSSPEFAGLIARKVDELIDAVKELKQRFPGKWDSQAIQDLAERIEALDIKRLVLVDSLNAVENVQNGFEERIKTIDAVQDDIESRINQISAKVNVKAQSDAPLPPTCRWVEDSDGPWRGDCGIEWELTEGTPVENDMKYCPRCGRSLVEHKPLPPTCGECEHSTVLHAPMNVSATCKLWRKWVTVADPPPDKCPLRKQSDERPLPVAGDEEIAVGPDGRVYHPNEEQSDEKPSGYWCTKCKKPTKYSDKDKTYVKGLCLECGYHAVEWREGPVPKDERYRNGENAILEHESFGQLLCPVCGNEYARVATDSYECIQPDHSIYLYGREAALALQPKRCECEGSAFCIYPSYKYCPYCGGTL